jgi:cytochrome bd ubiquinol oxidase subunit II
VNDLLKLQWKATRRGFLKATGAATHIFMLMGTLVMIPIILGYMVFVYWLFGGKLREGEGYH